MNYLKIVVKLETIPSLVNILVTITWVVISTFKNVFSHYIILTIHNTEPFNPPTGKDTKLAHSRVIDKASQELTKTAFAVTIIFIVTIGYDLHYYLLGYIGVLEYVLNAPIQKVGVFLSNLNSCLNPFVYAALMPTYRASVRKTFGCAAPASPASPAPTAPASQETVS